jgi:hypothetical protein
LVDSFVLGGLEVIFLCDGWSHKPMLEVSCLETALLTGTYRPPIKCRPLKCFTSGFGAVRLISAVGMKELPSPDFGGPSSISQDEGASTAVTGSFVS